MKLFVHIPKNGGMTVRKGMQSYPGEVMVGNRSHHVSDAYTSELRRTMDADGEHHGNEHARWRDWRKDLRDSCQAFAIIRNPWDRAVSRYTFMLYAIAQRAGNYRNYEAKTFPEFLEERHEWGGRPYYWHRAIRGWYPQKDYVTDDLGVLRCDCLRFGTDDVSTYLGRTLYPRNISNGRTDGIGVLDKKDYRKFYGPKEKRIIAEWYGDDIEFFGFTFDGPATKNIWTPT